MFGKRCHPVVIGALALLAVLILSTPRPTYAAFSCTSIASGNWSAKSTWTNCGSEPGVPGASDSATINSGHTVTLTSNVTVTTMSVVGTLDVATFTLTMAGGGVLSGTGTVQGAGTVRMEGTTTLTPGGPFNVAVVIATSTTTAYGTLGSTLTVATGATLSVSSSSSLTVRGDVTLNGTLSGNDSSSAFYFAGTTFTNSGATTIGYFYVQGAAPTLTGAGTWSGVRLRIYGPTAAGTAATLGNHLALTNGSLTIGDNAGADTLNLAGFDLTLSTSSLTVASNGTLVGAGSTVHTLGAVSLNSSVFSPALAVDSGVTMAQGTFGGTITVAAGATLQAGISSSCGTLTANGDVTVNGILGNYPGYACTLVFNGLTFTNNGAVTVSYTDFYGSGSQSVGGTGTWTGIYLMIGSSSTTLLANDVTFGVGTLTIDSGGTLAGSGACRTQGTLTINNSGAFNAPLEVLSGTTKAAGAFGGAITVAAGATLQAGISSSCGTLIANSNVTVNGVFSNYPSYACMLVFNGATFTNNGSTTVRYFYVQGAAPTLTGAGTWNGVYLRIYGPTSMSTATTLGSPLTLTNSYLTVGDDAGADTLNLAGFDLTLNGGSLTVASNGTLAGAGSTVHTLGSLTITSDGIFSPTLVVNSGATAAYGTLHGSVAIASAATLSVAGSSYRGDLTIKGDVTVNGTLSGYYSDSKLYFSGATFTNNGSTTVRSFYVQGATPTLTGAGAWSGVYLYIYGPTAAGTTTALGNHLTLTSGWLTIGNDAGTDTLDLAGFDLTLNDANLSVRSNGILTGNGTCRTQGTTQVNSDGAFNVLLEVQSGTTAATGAFDRPITVASGATLQAGISSSLTLLTANDDLTVNGMLTNNQTYACTLVFNGSTLINNGAVTVSAVQFGSGTHTLTGTGSFASGNSASILSGATLTLGSDHQMGKLTINAGGRLDITGRTLRLSGSGTPLTNNAGLANLVTTGSTVVYNGTSAQTVATSQVEYDSLAADNPAGVTLSVAKTIPGTVILSSGTFTVGTNLRLANGATIQRVAGSLSGTPVFGASVNVSYSGPGDVTTGTELPTAATVLNDLTINRASTVTLNQDQTVNGTLTLTSGTLAVSTRTLTLRGPVSSTAGNLSGAAGGTVVYAGISGAQNVGPGVYGNLTLDNPNGATGPAGLTVNGLLRIKQGAFTSASAYHDVQIDGGATLALSGDCTVSGNFTNSGALNANGRTVTFNGSGIQNLNANATTAFASLTISTGITLVETVAANNATVTGTLSNTGAIRKTQAIAAPGLATFGLTGVQMNVSAQGTLTSLQVDRVDANHPNATVGVRTGRYWTLTPNGGAGGYTVTLTFPHNGLAGPTVCRYTGADWDCVRTSFTPTTVTRSGITTLSPWAVGDGILPPVAPDVILSWTAIPADAEGYVVWYSETPYFLPGDPDAQSVTRPAGSTGWTHVGGGGNPAHNTYYIVQGVNGAGVRSGPSNRTGVFSSSLTPGVP